MKDRQFAKKCSVVPRGSAIPTERSYFTPRDWAIWLAESSGVVDAWLQGASILDPTCGRGDLLLGSIAAGIQRGRDLAQLPLHRLYGIEREPKYLRALIADCRREFGIEFPRGNLHAADFLLDPLDLRVDALIGNPPWANFADLPAAEKHALKAEFTRYGLTPDRRRLLLGGSRVDIAALVVVRAIADKLNANGIAAFFLPLSLLIGDGAHAGFRRYRAGDAAFALTQAFAFGDIQVFPGVSTRFGAMFFRRDVSPSWPVPWNVHRNGAWVQQLAAPIEASNGALATARDQHALEQLKLRPRIVMESRQKPRQGVNPCGASRVYFVSGLEVIDDAFARVDTPLSGKVVLPQQFLYPLMTSDQFAAKSAPPRRWVILPHDPVTGQPLTAEQLALMPELEEYLLRHRLTLVRRRGSWLKQWIDRGRWWALLGVGPYCFSPFRVAWPAYGATRFTPQVFAAPWQGQQALHAHIACQSLAEAQRLAKALCDPRVERYLQSFGTSGTRNFAQPGRVTRLLSYDATITSP